MFKFGTLRRCVAAATATIPTTANNNNAPNASSSSSAAAAAAAAALYAKNIKVSPRSWNHIHFVNTMEKKLNSKRPLRLSIESGGCRGFQYKFEFDEEAFDAEGKVADADDVEFRCPERTLLKKIPLEEDANKDREDGDEELPRVVVDKTTLEKLEGAVIDYHSELKGSAFVVVGNELVDAACACKMSFALK